MNRRPAGFGPVQLARWPGIKESRLRRAQECGLVPPPDVDGRRRSAAVAKTLPDRIEEILAGIEDRPESPPPPPTPTAPRNREGLGPIQLARRLGIKEWQLRRAQERGLVPPPDVDGHRWSTAVADTLPDRVEQILAVAGDHPGLGSEKAAERLTQRTGLQVERADVNDLAGHGLLRPVSHYKGWPIYALDDLDALPDDRIAAVVAERQRWIESSLTAAQAADLLGWPLGRFEVTAERRGVTPGRLDRYARTDVEHLTTDTSHPAPQPP